MSKRFKIILIILFTVIDGCLLSLYMSLKDYTLLNNLRNEVQTLANLNIGKDRYNLKIRCRGNYAVVEKAIKEYLDENAVLLQDTFGVLKDPKLTTILSYDNYAKDGPLFNESLKYITDSKKEFNDNLNTFINNLEEDKMASYIEEKTTDAYSKELYQELILSPQLKKQYEETKKLANTNSVKVNNVFDVSYAVLNFLATNNGAWVIENGEIKFASQTLYDQYMAYIGQLSMQ